MSLAENLGGGEIYLKRLTKLLKGNYDITIISTDVGGLLEELAELGAKTVLIKGSTWLHVRRSLLWWIWSARKHLRRKNVVVLYNGTGPAYFAPIFWLFAHIRGVLIAHTPTSLWRGAARQSILFVARRFIAGVVGVSDAVAAEVAELWPSVQVFSIPNWLEDAELDSHVVRGVKSRAGVIRAAVVSRLAPGKGVEDVLAVCADLDSLIHLDVFGDGMLRQQLLAQYGHFEHIRFHGMVRDVRQHIAAHDLLITASCIDTFSYSTAEGILQGLLCVVTKSDVFKELLGAHYPESLMFEYGDRQGLKRAIFRACDLLQGDQSKIGNTIAQSRARIQKRNNAAEAKDKYDKLIAAVAITACHESLQPQA